MVGFVGERGSGRTGGIPRSMTLYRKSSSRASYLHFFKFPLHLLLGCSSDSGNSQFDISCIQCKLHWYYYGKFLSFHSSNKHYLEAMDQILHLYNIPRDIIQNKFWVYFNYIFFNFYWNSKPILLSLFWKWSVLSMEKNLVITIA